MSWVWSTTVNGKRSAVEKLCFSHMVMQSRDFYAGYFAKMALYIQVLQAVPWNFSASIWICMSCAKLFYRGTFPVYGICMYIVPIHVSTLFYTFNAHYLERLLQLHRYSSDYVCVWNNWNIHIFHWIAQVIWPHMQLFPLFMHVCTCNRYENYVSGR